MPDLFLIAHKVRGEPAFDVAEQMTCAVCGQNEIAEDNHFGERVLGSTPGPGCHECDGLGFWWIVPTSGHRAYPYAYLAFNTMRDANTEWLLPKWAEWATKHFFNDAVPDHYTSRAAPRIDLATALGLKAKPVAPAAPLPRRL